MLQQAPKPLVASDLMLHAIEPWADSATGRALQAAAISFVGQAKRLPTAEDWKAITAAAALDKGRGTIASLQYCRDPNGQTENLFRSR